MLDYSVQDQETSKMLLLLWQVMSSLMSALSIPIEPFVRILFVTVRHCFGSTRKGKHGRKRAGKEAISTKGLRPTKRSMEGAKLEAESEPRAAEFSRAPEARVVERDPSLVPERQAGGVKGEEDSQAGSKPADSGSGSAVGPSTAIMTAESAAPEERQLLIGVHGVHGRDSPVPAVSSVEVC